MSPNQTNVPTPRVPMALKLTSRALPDPAAIDFDTIVAQLDAILAALGDGAISLTIDDRRRLLKMRPGGEEYTEAVIKAAARYGVVLPGIDHAAVTRAMGLLEKLGPVAARVTILNGLIRDLTLRGESIVWKATMSAYSMLVRYVQEFPDLQRELGPIASFLAVRFKDTPTSIRPQERRAMRKARKLKEKSDAASDAPASSETPPK
jgi:hypothetical protein